MPHYHPHLFRRTDIDGLRYTRRNIRDCCCTCMHTIYRRNYRYLATFKYCRPMLSHHSLAIHEERSEETGVYIGAVGDVVIFPYRRWMRGEDTEQTRRKKRRGSEGLVIATNESPESLANRPLLSLPFTLFVDLFCLWRRLGLLGELREGSPRVLAREIEDAFSTR